MFWKKKTRPNTWSIVSTMHGIPETVLPCIAHHLNTDAEKIHIYLDAPNPDIEAALATQPRCVVTVCDEAYWAATAGSRPEGIVRRQLRNLAHARKNSRSGWLVHLDSDEFLVSSDPETPVSLGAQLQLVPPAHDWARIMPLERILLPEQDPVTIFDGMFRRQTGNKSLVARAYGPGASYLYRGFSGHVRGKIAFRRNTRLTVGLHDVNWPGQKGRATPAGEAAAHFPPFTDLDKTRLLHFEGWTPLHWASKLVRFAEQGKFDGHQSGRRASVKFMADNPRAEDRLRLFDQVQRPTAEGVALLSEAGLLRQTPFDPTQLTVATFPDTPMDFSVAAFDARLRASSPDFFQRNGL